MKFDLLIMNIPAIRFQNIGTRAAKECESCVIPKGLWCHAKTKAYINENQKRRAHFRHTEIK